ncbi:prepilin-type N-terminal cleavage/methylation domain-containing protein [Shewanella sp. UCD-KL21]|uniref:prepilin-type N-terminal cleavage/methylation domain-containing protein n=1 Tax=Shewanella sp. UCD-KL21 TaxID=1917164 RepID=UPI000970F7F2|nr:prepilin-type N-terminal cleavage/methylation domain-containing protein [Shewanella sp. UCD-KL21]
MSLTPFSISSNGKSSGFTLIELVVVLLILAVLAVIAAPRFINLSTEANIASIKAMGGAILSSSKMVYAKSLSQGVEKIDKTTIDLDSDGIDDVEVSYGYPSASRSNSISKIMAGDFSNEWTWSTTYGDTRFWLTTAALAGRSGEYINQTAVRDSGCYILYDPATSSGQTPTVTYVTTDC